LSEFISLSVRFLSVERSGWRISKADRPPLSEPDATEEEETEDQLHEAADRRAGKALPQTKVSGVGGAGGAGQVAQDDGRAGEDLVPEQADEMEVREVSFCRSALWRDRDRDRARTSNFPQLALASGAHVGQGREDFPLG